MTSITAETPPVASVTAGGSRDEGDGHPGPRLTVLYALKYHLPFPWRFEATELPYSMARLVTAGSGIFTIDGEPHVVSTGSIMVVPEGTVLDCQATSAAFAFISVRFTSSMRVQGRDFVAEMLALPAISAPSEAAGLRGHFEAIVDVWAHSSPARSLLATGHLHIILGTLLAQATVPGPRSTDRERAFTARVQDPRIERVIDLLTSDERRTPNIGELCTLSHMSESTLRRSFKEHTGKTIGDYLRDLRMSSAARMLLLTDSPVGEVATELEFGDANYFARVFHSVFGISPSKYRQQARRG